MATAGEDKVENRMVYHGRLQATATVHDVIATTGSRNGYKSVVRLFWCDHTGTKFFGRRKRARYAFDQDVVRGAIRSCGCRRSKSWREVLERPKLAGSLRFCDHQAEVEGEELSVDETADIEAGAARAADGENGTPVEKKPRHTPPNKKVGISIADPMAAIRETRKVLLERMGLPGEEEGPAVRGGGAGRGRLGPDQGRPQAGGPGPRGSGGPASDVRGGDGRQLRLLLTDVNTRPRAG